MRYLQILTIAALGALPAVYADGKDDEKKAEKEFREAEGEQGGADGLPSRSTSPARSTQQTGAAPSSSYASPMISPSEAEAREVEELKRMIAR